LHVKKRRPPAGRRGHRCTRVASDHDADEVITGDVGTGEIRAVAARIKKLSGE